MKKVPSDEEFEQYINAGLDKIPELYLDNLNNLAITTADEPSAEQREKLRLRCGQTLFGLYEGIPLTKRGAGYNLVLPDKITIFKLPITAYAQNIEGLKEQVYKTIWHEIAHFFGLNHEQIHKLEK